MTSVDTNEMPSENLNQSAESKFKWVRQVTIVVVIILALIPPALIVADRWLDILSPDILYEIWCDSWKLCSSAVPSYFMIIYFCCIAIPILIFSLRNQVVIVIENAIQHSEEEPVGKSQVRAGFVYQMLSILGFIIIVVKCLYTKTIPGWELIYVWICFMTGCLIETITISSSRDQWKKDGEFWLALLLAHVSLVGLLVGIYGKPDLLLSTIVLAGLAAANLWRFRRQVPSIFWIMSLAMVVFTIDINSWWTAVWGDEYIFHQQAWIMADRMSYQDLGKILFSSTGVGGRYPYFPSFIQAIFMKFLGSESFGWRFSNVYFCSMAVGLFYSFCKTFVSKRLSLIAAFLFAVSSCIMSFSKIGYDNLQALFAMTLVLASSAWVLRSELNLAYVCLGSAMALCFYVYPVALYVLPLPLILLCVYHFPRTRETIRHWIILFLVLLSLIFPLLMQPDYWSAKIAGTFFNQPAIFQSTQTIVAHFAENLLYAFLSFLYVFAESHFITASYVDPLTGASILIGLSVLIIQARRQRFPLFILFTFIYLTFIIGASHDRRSPPHTRMFLLIPVYALIAAWGISWVCGCLKKLFIVSNSATIVVKVVMIIAITCLNLYQAYPLSHVRYAHRDMLESLFIRLSQNVQATKPRTTFNYVIILEPSWGIDGFLMLQKVYPHLAWAHIKQIVISDLVLPESSKPMLKEKNTIAILQPWMETEWVDAVDRQLRELEMESCGLLSYSGTVLTRLYHSPDLPQACSP